MLHTDFENGDTLRGKNITSLSDICSDYNPNFEWQDSTVPRELVALLIDAHIDEQFPECGMIIDDFLCGVPICMPTENFKRELVNWIAQYDDAMSVLAHVVTTVRCGKMSFGKLSKEH